MWDRLLAQGMHGGGEGDGRQQLAGMQPGHPDYEQAVRMYAEEQAQARGMAGGASFPGARVRMFWLRWLSCSSPYSRSAALHATFCDMRGRSVAA